MITEFYWFNTGYSTGLEWLTKGSGSWKKLTFPAYCGLLKDDRYGYILFDTGYGPTFKEATRRWPFRLYRWITPVYYTESMSILSHLRRINLTPTDIQYVFVSHLHADHIGYLKTFDQSRFIYHEQLLQLLSIKPFSQVKQAFLPELLPPTFVTNARLLQERESVDDDTLGMTWPLFDGTCTAVYLPGHARGQTGLYFDYQGQTIFLVADTSWMTSAIINQSRPHALVNLIIDNANQYDLSLQKVHRWHQQNPEAIILPSHCTETQYAFKIDQ